MRDQIILIFSYLHGIWCYRWSALFISCVIALIGWTVVYAMPNFYSSKAIVQVDTKSVMTPLLKGLAVDSEIEAGLNLMTRVLLSRKNLEDVVRQTDMDLEAYDDDAMDRIVLELASSISLTSGGRKKGNNIYELSYQGKSPELVYQVVSKLLNTLIENTLDSARTDTASAQKFLDRQISQYEIRLSTAEQALAKFKQNNVGFMPDETGGYYSRLQRAKDKLEKSHSELRLAKRRHSEMLRQLQGETPMLDSNAKFKKLRKYRAQLEELQTRYEEQHPDIVALKSTIADLMASDDVLPDEDLEMNAEENFKYNPVYQDLKADVNRARVEIETLKIRVMENEEKVESLLKAVDVLPEVEAQLAKLNRDYDITRERYRNLVKRKESAHLAQEVGLSGDNIKFRILDPPRVPPWPAGPDRIVLLSMVFLAALAAGLGWGFIRYLLHPTFIDSSQLRDKIGLPILGSVGLYLTKQHKRRRRLQLFSFYMAFLLMVVSYGGVLLYEKPGSKLVGDIVAARGWTI